MSWFYLIMAGLTEIGWPIGLKIAQSGQSKFVGISMAVGFMVISGSFLFMAQKTIPMGTAYAVWTGIGATGTFLVGVFLYGDATSIMRYVGVLLIISGVLALKFAH
ncbi:multidrug efflux SMR transporter [Vibrio sp.]|nr:multidrug efflux SMR transporter [Vibrio sp.]